MPKINITITGIDGGVKVFPARDALQTSGDYLVIQGVGHMNFIPLAQIESLDFFNEEAAPVPVPAEPAPEAPADVPTV